MSLLILAEISLPNFTVIIGKNVLLQFEHFAQNKSFFVLFKFVIISFKFKMLSQKLQLKTFLSMLNVIKFEFNIVESYLFFNVRLLKQFLEFLLKLLKLLKFLLFLIKILFSFLLILIFFLFLLIIIFLIAS